MSKGLIISSAKSIKMYHTNLYINNIYTYRNTYNKLKDLLLGHSTYDQVQVPKM